MSELIDKVLKSGLVDKHTAQFMEQWGYLPEGASEKVGEDLKNATKDQLLSFAKDLEEEVEKRVILKETHMDLDKLRWPVEVNLLKVPRGVENMSMAELRFHTKMLAGGVQAVIDRMGRYYFRYQDVQEHWLRPGYAVERRDPTSGIEVRALREQILEVQPLYIGDQPVCYQVTTQGLPALNGI